MTRGPVTTPSSAAAELPLQGRLTRLYQVARADVPASRAVVVGVWDGKSETVVGFGEVAPGNSAAPNADTVFDVGSLTKVFLGALLARESARGNVRLDEDAQRHLPAVRLPTFGANPIKLVDLATYSAALPNMPEDWASTGAAGATGGGHPYTAEMWEAFFARYSLPRAPGTRFEYSNIGFGLLGEALANASGGSLGGLLRDDIFTPLGMRNTSMLDEPLRGSPAQGYDADGQPDSEGSQPLTAGWGGVRSSAGDLLRFLRAFSDEGTDGELRRALDLTLTPRLAAEGDDDAGLQ